jgi:hypothetical protein
MQTTRSERRQRHRGVLGGVPEDMTRTNGSEDVPENVPLHILFSSVLEIFTAKCLMPKRWKGGRVV